MMLFLQKVVWLLWIIKTILYKISWAKIGGKTKLHITTSILNYKNIKIWKNCFLNIWTIIDAKWWVNIWNNVLIWPYSCIWSLNHNFQEKERKIDIQWFTENPVKIGDDTWIWMHVVILPWVEIWQWCVIWAWSIVTKNIPPYSIAVWNPAKIIKQR